EKDPVLRIKALHDYVADRIAYDSDAFYSGDYGDQDAQAVFEKRKGVCAGYANLLSALAAAINEEIVVVAGDARNIETGNQLTGTGHAWSAAHINGRWYLMDACWDAGYVSREKGFTKAYKTDYLLPPPEVMIEDHFPEDDTWQLLSQPLSQGDFLRQPMLRPSFQAADLTLVSPLRALNESGSKAFAVVKNPKNEWLIAGLEQNGKQIGYSTQPTNSPTAQMECAIPDKGTYRLNMFLNEHQHGGQYKFVGSLDFVNR
ncbi:MAG TPA: transglutaminase domain-containing protein, partial [Candidatus Obscuribacterales bacterium]